MKPQASSSLAGPESHLKPIHWRCSPLHLKLGSPVTNQMSRDRELKEQQLPWSLLFYPVGKSTEFCSVLYFLTSGGGEGDWRWEGGTKHTTTRVTLLSGFPPKYWDRRPPRTVPELGWSLSAHTWPQRLWSHRGPGQSSWSGLTQPHNHSRAPKELNASHACE